MDAAMAAPTGLRVRGESREWTQVKTVSKRSSLVPRDFHCVLSHVWLEPTECLGPQRDDVAADPEASQQLNEERAKSFLHRFGVSFVARRLVGNRVRQQGKFKCLLKLNAGVFRSLALAFVSPENSLAHQFACRADERLTMANLVPAQVAPKKTDRRIERAGEQDRLKRVFMHLLIHLAIDRHVFANRFLPDSFDQIINGPRGSPSFFSPESSVRCPGSTGCNSTLAISPRPFRPGPSGLACGFRMIFCTTAVLNFLYQANLTGC